mgnify:CR=1 FL=1
MSGLLVHKTSTPSSSNFRNLFKSSGPSGTPGNQAKTLTLAFLAQSISSLVTVSAHKLAESKCGLRFCTNSQGVFSRSVLFSDLERPLLNNAPAGIFQFHMQNPFFFAGNLLLFLF